MQSRLIIHARSLQLPLQRLIFDLPPVGLRYWLSMYLYRPISFSPSQVPAVANPRTFDRHPFLVHPDLVLDLHREAYIIQSVDQAMLPEFFNVEARYFLSVFIPDFLGREVDLDFPTSLGFVSNFLDDGLLSNGDWQIPFLNVLLKKMSA